MTSYNRLLIVEDQTILLDLFSSILANESLFSHVSKATNAEEAIAFLENGESYDLVLSDLMLGEKSGLELLKAIRQSTTFDPGTKVIIITAFYKPGYFKSAMSMKLNGFMLKDTSLEELKRSIHRVMEGEIVVSDEILQTSFETSSVLADKDIEILKKVLEGKSNKVIANELCLSEGTIKNYISSIMKKTKTSNRLQAAIDAKDQGWI